VWQTKDILNFKIYNSLVRVHHQRSRAGRLAQCQLNVTGWGIMFICGMVLRCAGTLKTRLESEPVTADLTTTVVHTRSYKLLINNIKPVHSLKIENNL